MFLEKFCECRNRDIEGIVAIMLVDSRKLGSRGYAPGFLEFSKERLGLGVDCVNQRRKGSSGGVVEKSTFLEKK